MAGDDGTMRLSLVVNNPSAISDAMESSAVSVKAGSGQMVAGFEEVGAASTASAAQVSEAAAQIEYSHTEARHAVMGLGEEIGVHMPRFVQSFIASSSLVGPALASAFSVVAVVGLIQVLEQVPDAIDKIIGKLSGWDEAAKKSYEDQIKLNNEIIVQNIEEADKKRELTTIGLTGTAKLAIEQANAALKAKDLATADNLVTQEIAKANTLLDHQKGTWQSLIEDTNAVSLVMNAMSGSADKVTEAQKNLPILIEQQKKLQELQRQTADEQAKLKPEDAVAGRTEALKLEAEQAKVNEQLATAQLTNLIQFMDAKQRLEDEGVKKSVELAQQAIHTSMEQNQESLRLRIDTNRQEIEESNRVAKAIMADEDQILQAKTATANQTLAYQKENDDNRLRTNQITLKQWQQQETAAIEQWANTQRQELLHALEVAKLVYGEDAAEYKKLIEKLNALDAERAAREQKIDDQVEQKHHQTMLRIQSDFNSTVASILTGQETIKQGYLHMMESLLTDTITYLLRIVEQWIIQSAVIAAIKAIFGAKPDDASQRAQDAANATAKIQDDSATAQADVFLQAIEYVPFPANMIAAPAAAATVGAAMSTIQAEVGKFEQGGLVPSTGLHLLHEKEMVLPAPISMGFQKMLSTGSPSSGGGSSTSIHAPINYSPSISGGFNSPAEFREMLDNHADHIGSIVRRQIRQGRLGQ